jgi:hypothetical protein
MPNLPSRSRCSNLPISTSHDPGISCSNLAGCSNLACSIVAAVVKPPISRANLAKNPSNQTQPVGGIAFAGSGSIRLSTHLGESGGHVSSGGSTSRCQVPTGAPSWGARRSRRELDLANPAAASSRPHGEVAGLLPRRTRSSSCVPSRGEQTERGGVVWGADREGRREEGDEPTWVAAQACLRFRLLSTGLGDAGKSGPQKSQGASLRGGFADSFKKLKTRPACNLTVQQPDQSVVINDASCLGLSIDERVCFDRLNFSRSKLTSLITN